MEAIERIIGYDYWITILFVLCIIILSVLKLLKPNKLYGFAIAFFTPGFFYKQTEENNSFFTSFQLLLFSFMCLVISLFLFEITPEQLIEKSFSNFSIILGLITLYLLIRFSFDTFLVSVLGLKNILTYFLFSKLGYLKTLSIWLLPILILNQYAIKNSFFLIVLFFLLLIFRFFLLIYNNKRLVVNKLFYFILYLCALEIAPLLILFKTTTT